VRTARSGLPNSSMPRHALVEVVFQDALLIGEVLADPLDFSLLDRQGAGSLSTPSRVKTRTSMTVPSFRVVHAGSCP